MIKPAFSYVGGKSKLLDQLLTLFPEHNTYVEAFSGSAVVLLNKKPCNIEVLNDKDEHLINFFRVLRDKDQFDELMLLLENTPHSRQEYYVFKERFINHEWESNVQWAYYWYVLATMSFGGRFLGGYGYHVTGTYSATKRFREKFENLEPVRTRLLHVQIENDSFENILNRYDSKNTLFYLDPPYIKGAQQSEISGDYFSKMTVDDHQTLLDIIVELEGKVVISGYKHEMYVDELEGRGWRRFDFEVHTGLAGGRVKKDRETGKGTSGRIESVWANKGAQERSIIRRSVM